MAHLFVYYYPIVCVFRKINGYDTDGTFILFHFQNISELYMHILHLYNDQDEDEDEKIECAMHPV